MSITNESESKEDIVILKEIMSEDYKPKYFKECKFIWKNYVPKRGQSEVLQGELLRMVEKLRYEAQNNGNINWDNDFSFFCDFLKETLSAQTIYSDDEKRRFVLILNHLQKCGNYAEQYGNGEISDEKFDVFQLVYVEDNLYDVIADAVGKFQNLNPTPIPYKLNKNVKR